MKGRSLEVLRRVRQAAKAASAASAARTIDERRAAERQAREARALRDGTAEALRATLHAELERVRAGRSRVSDLTLAEAFRESEQRRLTEQDAAVRLAEANVRMADHTETLARAQLARAQAGERAAVGGVVRVRNEERRSREGRDEEISGEAWQTAALRRARSR